MLRVDTKDMPTEHGSAIYKGSQPEVDASIVGLLRAAGAIIIGKTVRSLVYDSVQETDSRPPLNSLLELFTLEQRIRSILPNLPVLHLQDPELLYRIINVIWHWVLRL